MSPLEVAAVGFAVAYLLLAIRQNIWCWAAALLSTGLYVMVMYRAALYMEAVLQFFYIGMAVYGWYKWTAGQANADSLPVTTWPVSQHEQRRGQVELAVYIKKYGNSIDNKPVEPVFEHLPRNHPGRDDRTPGGERVQIRKRSRTKAGQ